jgi:hypothetical protein
VFTCTKGKEENDVVKSEHFTVFLRRRDTFHCSPDSTYKPHVF